MSNPGTQHEKLLDKLISYLRGTQNRGLFYQSDPNIIGYSDADWGGDTITRRSTTGYLYLFMNSPISWNSRLQKTVALSSCEAEYMALKEAIKEQVYIRTILQEIGIFTPIKCDILYTDSNSAIELAKNPVFHNRTKHIDIQYHFVREKVINKETNLLFIPTTGQLADALTKPLSLDKFAKFISGIGLKDQKDKKEDTLLSLGQA